MAWQILLETRFNEATFFADRKKRSTFGGMTKFGKKKVKTVRRCHCWLEFVVVVVPTTKFMGTVVLCEVYIMNRTFLSHCVYVNKVPMSSLFCS